MAHTNATILANMSQLPKADLEDIISEVNQYNYYFDSNIALTAGELKAMFDLYNTHYGVREYGVHCGSCRQRVYKHVLWLRKTAQEIIANYESEENK